MAMTEKREDKYEATIEPYQAAAIDAMKYDMKARYGADLWFKTGRN